jgi:transposase
VTARNSHCRLHGGLAPLVSRSYALGFRGQVVELVRRGRSVSAVAAEIGVSGATVDRWGEQDRIDRGERPGLSSVERVELARPDGGSESSRPSWRSRRASALLAEGELRPKGVPVVAALAGQGSEAKRCCPILGVPPSSRVAGRLRVPTCAGRATTQAAGHRLTQAGARPTDSGRQDWRVRAYAGRSPEAQSARQRDAEHR